MHGFMLNFFGDTQLIAIPFQDKKSRLVTHTRKMMWRGFYPPQNILDRFRSDLTHVYFSSASVSIY